MDVVLSRYQDVQADGAVCCGRTWAPFWVKRLATIFLLAYPALGHGALSGTERTWTFMQSVGGIAVGTPEKEKEEWLLPVFCDVSGLKQFTVEPTSVNSALVWVGTKAKVVGWDILITIETGVADFSGNGTTCGAARLRSIKEGAYRVIYQDPDGSTHPVGQVEIGY